MASKGSRNKRAAHISASQADGLLSADSPEGTDGIGGATADISTTLTDSVSVAIYHFTSIEKPLYVNPAFRKMFSIGADQSYDVWINNVHPGDRARVDAAWTKFATAAHSPQGEFITQYRTLSADGTVRHLVETLVPAVGLSGWVGTVIDITELVQAQAELERAHRALMTASRQAGMAEVASSVLHNVGNVLNSVNVSANTLESRLREMRISGLGRVSAMLDDLGDGLASFLTTDERGKRFPKYLSELSSQLRCDQDSALQDLSELLKSIEHIKEIVRMQQGYATLHSLIESVLVVELVEDSVRLNAEAFARHGITLKREFEEVPAITLDKHKALLILVNLIRNAKYACEDAECSDKCITLRVYPCPLGVGVAVIDNGIGIPAENMTRIFDQGFTTRPGGHGFGLHSAALAARELGGALRAVSDGIGRGATFILELPLTSPKALR